MLFYLRIALSLDFCVFIMQEIISFVNGRVFPIEQLEPLLIPLVLSRVSAGFPSPADDYIETSIDGSF